MSEFEPRYAGPTEDPDRYVLWTTIGGGGEGVVIRGTRTFADGATVSVAVKIYDRLPFATPETLDSFLERLKSQAARLQLFNHPGLAPVHDVFAGARPHARGAADHSEQVPYFVMGLIEGEDLVDWIVQEPVVRRRLRVLEDAAAALDEMHRRGVVHADVKPSNLRISRVALPDGGEVTLAVLVDFGLMRAVTGLPPTDLVGSMGYVAPELVSGAPFSPASDLYAFAATAAYALTGVHQVGPEQILLACRSAGLPEESMDVLAEALNPDPTQRVSALKRGVSGWLSRLRGGFTTTVVPSPAPRQTTDAALAGTPGRGHPKLGVRLPRRALFTGAIASVLAATFWVGSGARQPRNGDAAPSPGGPTSAGSLFDGMEEEMRSRALLINLELNQPVVLPPPLWPTPNWGLGAMESRDVFRASSQTRGGDRDLESWIERNELEGSNPAPGTRAANVEHADTSIPPAYLGRPLVDVISYPDRWFLLYGENGRGRFLFAIERPARNVLYGLDFASYEFAPPTVDASGVGASQEITWAAESDGVLYVATGHKKNAKASSYQNAYITALDVENGFQVLWRSTPLVSNARNFLLLRSPVLIAGYGFEGEESFLFALNSSTGAVLQSYKLASRPLDLARKDDRLYVRTRDRDYAFLLVG